jgi:hypothetical protein
MYEGHSLKVDLLELFIDHNEIVNGIQAINASLISFLGLIEDLGVDREVLPSDRAKTQKNQIISHNMRFHVCAMCSVILRSDE